MIEARPREWRPGPQRQAWAVLGLPIFVSGLVFVFSFGFEPFVRNQEGTLLRQLWILASFLGGRLLIHTISREQFNAAGVSAFPYVIFATFGVLAAGALGYALSSQETGPPLLQLVFLVCLVPLILIRNRIFSPSLATDARNPGRRANGLSSPASTGFAPHQRWGALLTLPLTIAAGSFLVGSCLLQAEGTPLERIAKPIAALIVSIIGYKMAMRADLREFSAKAVSRFAYGATWYLTLALASTLGYGPWFSLGPFQHGIGVALASGLILSLGLLLALRWKILTEDQS